MKDPIFICKDGVNRDPNQVIQTQGGFHCWSQKIFTSGSWYGEITHLSGTNAHFFGVETKCGNINFYPDKNLNNPYITINNCFSETGINQYISLPFKIENEHTVGIVFNSKERIFTVVYNNNFYSHSFQSESVTGKPYKFRFGGANTSDSSDEITLNFGHKSFTYNIPSLAFNNYTCKVSCREFGNIHINTFLLMNLYILTK